eukprot:gnl/Dysnectes_brevis/2536_a3051_1151.p1 GENE.gnl/Dysnectes_brevis/2536_a3051_1151~~gnl/Dysnectes_brevis/2536_a3051_1151.p1  ORF type:complete len:421 (-),score=44.27 gnl/Dysnectes_brevis/2536_a3051_1151:37-1260(-)
MQVDHQLNPTTGVGKLFFGKDLERFIDTPTLAIISNIGAIDYLTPYVLQQIDPDAEIPVVVDSTLLLKYRSQIDKIESSHPLHTWMKCSNRMIIASHSTLSIPHAQLKGKINPKKTPKPKDTITQSLSGAQKWTIEEFWSLMEQVKPDLALAPSPSLSSPLLTPSQAKTPLASKSRYRSNSLHHIQQSEMWAARARGAAYGITIPIPVSYCTSIPVTGEATSSRARVTALSRSSTLYIPDGGRFRQAGLARAGSVLRITLALSVQSLIHRFKEGYNVVITDLPMKLADRGLALSLPCDPQKLESDCKQTRGASMQRSQRMWVHCREMEMATDSRPLVEGCGCPCCSRHSRAYVHHLLSCHEMTGMTLLTTHNVHWLLQLTKSARVMREDETAFENWCEDILGECGTY